MMRCCLLYFANSGLAWCAIYAALDITQLVLTPRGILHVFWDTAITQVAVCACRMRGQAVTLGLVLWLIHAAPL